MLKLYICPSCRGTRYVSLENTTCYRCSCSMVLSDLPYADYIELEPTERKQHIQDFMVKYTNAKKSDNLYKDTSQNPPFQGKEIHPANIIINSKRSELPLYEQEPVSLKHCEEIILLSNMRMFRGVS